MSKTKSNKVWALRNKETGTLYPEFTYKSREAARKAAKGRRFKGQYTPCRLSDVKTTTTGEAYRVVITQKDPTNFSHFVKKMGFFPFWIWDNAY